MSDRVFSLILLAIFLIPVCLAASELDVCKNNANICKADKKAKDKYSQYMKLQYNGDFFLNIGDISSNMKTFPGFYYPNTFGALKTAVDNPPTLRGYYSAPHYKPTYIGGGIALGYSLPTNSWAIPRMEMEILHSRVKIDDTGLS